MHIGIDARFLGARSYGLAQYSESLLQALSRQDKTTRYTVFVNAALKRRPKLGNNFNIVPIAGRPLSVRGLFLLALALRRERPNILHVHFPLAPLGVDCPTLITVHDVVPFRRSETLWASMSFWDRVGMFFLYPRTMRRSRWILCVSSATRNRLVEIFPETFHKTIVRPSGVEELYREKTESETADLIRHRLDLPQQYLLYSGSIGENKNIIRMIDAFLSLKRDHAEAAPYELVLDITGESRGLNQLQTGIRRLGGGNEVRLMTSLSAEERRVVFEGASLFLILSREEGFGAPVLKAQMLGVPVMAADAGALPEVCGKGAMLVDPDNQDEIVAGLYRLLFDERLRSELSGAGRKNAQRYSWDDTARQVKQIYELLF
jgi:glycosyltransferase involved in cell wall biosynthesis